MKKDLFKKMKGYTIAAGAVLATGASANAQIVYTDIDPDETFTDAGTEYVLDLNNDAVNDFTIQRQSASVGQAIRMQAASGNEVLGSTSAGSYFLPFALDQNAVISVSQNLWNGTMNGGSLTLAWGSTYGYWANGQTDKYLGFKFQIGADTHYGWLRLDATAGGNSFTVKDFAYESTPDAAINAGDMGGGTTPAIDDISTANITENSVDILLTPNVDGDAYYVVLLETETAPTAAEVVAGTGSGGASAVTSGNAEVTGSTEYTFNITDLTAASSYTAYLVLDDGIVKALSDVYDIDFSTSVDVNTLADIKVNIFPNPSEGIFKINTELNNFQVSVKDITGKTIINNSKNINTIDLKNFGAGTYFIQITTETGVLNKRVIVK